MLDLIVRSASEFIIGPRFARTRWRISNHELRRYNVAAGSLESCSSAALRRQSRHRQSPPSTGIGRMAVSSAHQQGPATLQMNAVPHREQARRRGGAFSMWALSNRFVMKPTDLNLVFGSVFHVGFIRNGAMIRIIRAGQVQGNFKRKSDGPRFASRSGRA